MPSCWFTSASLGGDGGVATSSGCPAAALPTLLALQATVDARAADARSPTPGAKPSWTARLLADPALLCSKVREEADELCRTLEDGEGGTRSASEAADLLYHALVLLRTQGVGVPEVLAVLRARFGVSGVAEKAARPAKEEG